MTRLAMVSKYGAVIVLVLAAALHLSGLPWAQQATAVEGLAPFMKAAIIPLWLFASVHWLVLAAILVANPSQHDKASRTIVVLAAFMMFVDAGLLFAYIGPFVGGYALAMAGLLLILSILSKFKTIG